MAAPTRPRTRLAREERREQIVDAAAEVFQGRDPAEVTFEEIADAAGVSRALVYNYFGDRHGLLEAVYLRNVGVLRERVQRALSETKGRSDALAQAVRVHLEFAASDPWGYRYAAGRVNFARLDDLHEELVVRVARTLGGGPEAMLAASGFVATLFTMVCHWLSHDGVPVDRAEDLITAFLGRGLMGLHERGVSVTPTWPVPAP
jgi:AcrR family transcriptional regulator